MKIPWELLPRWANFLTVDKGKKITVWEFRPRFSLGLWFEWLPGKRFLNFRYRNITDINIETDQSKRPERQIYERK